MQISGINLDFGLSYSYLAARKELQFKNPVLVPSYLKVEDSSDIRLYNVCMFMSTYIIKKSQDLWPMSIILPEGQGIWG